MSKKFKVVPLSFAEVVICLAALAGNVLLRMHRQHLAGEGLTENGGCSTLWHQANFHISLQSKVCLSFSFIKCIKQFGIESTTFVILRITTCYKTKEQRLGVEGNLEKGKKQRKNEDVKQLCLVWKKKNKLKKQPTKPKNKTKTPLHLSPPSLSFF